MSGFTSSGSDLTGIMIEGKYITLPPPAVFCARNIVGCWRILCGEEEIESKDGIHWRVVGGGGGGGGLTSLLISVEVDSVVVGCCWSEPGLSARTDAGGLPWSSTLLPDEERRLSEDLRVTIFVQSVGRSWIPIASSVCPIRYLTVNFPHSLPILHSFFSCTS